MVPEIDQTEEIENPIEFNFIRPCICGNCSGMKHSVIGATSLNSLLCRCEICGGLNVFRGGSLEKAETKSTKKPNYYG
jgi:hypothetical protein